MPNPESKDLVRVSRSLLDDELFQGPSAIQTRLIDASTEIREAPPDEISFQHTVLCQTGLPYKETKERRWEKKNGRVVLEIEAGRVLHPERQEYVDMPLPYGPKARLVLIYLCSTAIRNQSPIIDVERSMTAFIRELINREPNGKEIKMFKQQIAALSSATIRMATTIEGRSLQVNNQIVYKFDLWMERAEYNQRVLWPETVDLSLDFFNTLLEHAVPLDQRAVSSLQHSSMALDIYMWLAQRLWRVNDKTGQTVPWTALREQFGSGYKHVRQFRDFFLDQLRDVLSQYPTAKVMPYSGATGPTDGGLTLHRSPPPVQQRRVYRIK
jgi:hypothetical protein